MGAGAGSDKFITNGMRVVDVLRRDMANAEDEDHLAQMICDALNIDPEGEWENLDLHGNR